MMGPTGFDRAASRQADNTTAIVVKTKKSKRKRLTVRISGLTAT